VLMIVLWERVSNVWYGALGWYQVTINILSYNCNHIFTHALRFCFDYHSTILQAMRPAINREIAVLNSIHCFTAANLTYLLKLSIGLSALML